MNQRTLARMKPAGIVLLVKNQGYKEDDVRTCASHTITVSEAELFPISSFSGLIDLNRTVGLNPVPFFFILYFVHVILRVAGSIHIFLVFFFAFVSVVIGFHVVNLLSVGV